MSLQHFRLFFFVFFFIGVERGFCQQNNYSSSANQFLLQYCAAKAKLTALNSLTDLTAPVVINKGEKSWTNNFIADWRSGFWPGIAWYLFESTQDSFWKRTAETASQKLTHIIDTAVSNHDLGFQFFCSYGNGYRLTHNAAYKKILLRAADSLATLFNPRVGTILSWRARGVERGWPHNTIIDNMMNIELLFWASKNGGSKKLYEYAVRHAETTMKFHFRPDYSTYHVLVYDTTTAQPLQRLAHQGYANNSMWARGQAWSIYGFTMAFRETKKDSFLLTAMRAADLYLKRLPSDYIPYWDFDDPAIPNAPRDVSAATITASALLELSTLCSDSSLSKKYFSAATAMLAHLSTATYLSNQTNNAFLLSSTGNKPANKDIDVPIIYADYYFLEALLRYKKIAK